MGRLFRQAAQLFFELCHTQRRVSRTDLESGYLNRPESPTECMI
ncbi:MAG: hypothetical protein RR135_06810 [Oscillospiraceae bacterium]